MDVAGSDRRGTHQCHGAAARDLGLQRQDLGCFLSLSRHYYCYYCYYCHCDHSLFIIIIVSTTI